MLRSIQIYCYIYLFSLLILLGCSRDPQEPVVFTDTDIDIKEIEDIYDPQSVKHIMQKVWYWQLKHPVSMNDGNGMAWARSAFYVGIMAAYSSTLDDQYLTHATLWSQSKRWRLDKRYDHADDHASGQTFLEIFFVEQDDQMIQSAKNTFDHLIQEERVGRELYWWADALFMSPPVLARLYKATGEQKYLDFLGKTWWDSYELLYDTEEDLFFQSHWFFNYKTPNGFKTFWARANGWVMAGTVRILQYLPPENEYYPRFVNLHQRMAARIVQLQQEDGLWRPSLLDSIQAPFPETSSTAFFTYALAWGVNNGHLERALYLPYIEKAWAGMVNVIHPDGKLGWVQPGGSHPDEVTYDDYQEFGAGAFLLAGSEMYKLGLTAE